MIIFLYMIVGVLAGLFAGLLGTGGGIIIVPGLLYIFAQQDFSIEYIPHLAVGTSLATITFTAVFSTYAHHKKGAVLWKLFAMIAPGILIGSLLGSLFAGYLRGQVLMIILGLLIIIIAQRMRSENLVTPREGVLSRYKMSAVGALIGWFSALAGIGGGSMTVPFLARCKVSLRHAVATSAACGFPLAVAGMVGFVISGWQVSDLPNWTTGYVYWPACLSIVATSMATAILGANLAHVLPAKTIRRVFVFFLTAVGISIVYSGITFTA